MHTSIHSFEVMNSKGCNGSFALVDFQIQYLVCESILQRVSFQEILHPEYHTLYSYSNREKRVGKREPPKSSVKQTMLT